VSLKLASPSEWLDRSTWLFVLLILAMLFPTACVLWFLNEAVTTQSAAARQRVLEAYRGQLRLVRARIDAHWHAQATSLNITGTPEQEFARLALSEAVEGAVFLQPDGTLAYPNRSTQPSANSAAMEQLLSALERPGEADRGHVDNVAARLNDYSFELTGEERLRLAKRGTNDPQAHEAYLRGRFYWNTFTEDGFAKAIVCYNQAIALDPNYALAYAGIAAYYNWLGSFTVLPFAECSAAAHEARKPITAENTPPRAGPACSEGGSRIGYD